MDEAVRGAGGFSQRISLLLDRVDYRLATSDDELDRIYRLRYDANLREGAITANETRKLVDRFDDAPNALNFGIYIDDVLTSALRMHIVSADQPVSPALDAFPDLLAEPVRSGVRIIDGNRFVAEYPRARSFPELPYVTLRIGILAAVHFECDMITASVRSEHFPFYKREYMAAKLCEPRPYPTLVKPLSLISIDFRQNGGAIIARHPFYQSTADERRRLFAAVSSSA
ncbi:MAG: N-acyl amino acid synthase FeeM domain-containing protein [Beijerinckiaceae bacterium]